MSALWLQRKLMPIARPGTVSSLRAMSILQIHRSLMPLVLLN